MTTNANAPVGQAKILPKHWDDAAGAPMSEVAQSLANLEAANNRLAEIDRIADPFRGGTDFPGRLDKIAALASGHTPSPCPDCAAKDEAMGAFKADLSDTLIEYYGGYENSRGEDLSRFIIPPADPVVEAIREMALTDATQDDAERLRKALASRGLEITELSGGAK